MCKSANVQMCKSIFQNSQQNNLYYILYYNIIYNINNNLKVTLQNANRICTFAHLHICTKLLEKFCRIREKTAHLQNPVLKN